MRFTKLLAGTALIAMSTVSAHAVVSSDSGDICIGTGTTEFEQNLSQQECFAKKQQAKMAEWEQQAEARKKSVSDLKEQIEKAPADQKAALQDKLHDLQASYEQQSAALTAENDAQTENAQKLMEDYNKLPKAEKARVQLRMNRQMAQQKLDAAKDFEQNGKLASVSAKAQAGVDAAKDTAQKAKDSVEAAKEAAEGDIASVKDAAKNVKDAALGSDATEAEEQAAQAEASVTTDAATTETEAVAPEEAPAPKSLWESIKSFFKGL